MEQESCFICGVKIGRGNRTEVGSQEKMEKLISVSNTVEHSSTIISDILSRILNETVMREEIVCRICYNLLNDVDYHLKEAQEKTDEITAKFLDKEKDPLHYNPSRLLDPLDTRALDHKQHSRSMGLEGRREKRGKLVTTSGIRPDSRQFTNNIQISQISHKKGDSSSGRKQMLSPAAFQVMNSRGEANFAGGGGGGGAGRAGHQHPSSPPQDSEVGASSADEMTVNALAEKKRRLISRVLAPGKRAKHHHARQEEEDLYEDSGAVEPTYEELTITLDSDKEKDDLREVERRRKKERKKRKKEKERRERKEREEQRKQETVLRLGQQNTVRDELKENTSPQRNKGEIRTVDLAQLGHLFSSSTEDKSIQMVGKKSVQTPAERKQMDYTAEGQTFYLIPENIQPQSIQLGEIGVDHHDNDMGAEEAAPLAATNVPATGSTKQQAAGSHQHHQVQHHQQTLKLSHQVRAEMTASSNRETTAAAAPSSSSMITQEFSSPPPPPTATVAAVSPAVTNAALSMSITSDAVASTSRQVMTKTAQKSTPTQKEKSEPSIPCPHCNKKFMRSHNMRVHIHRVHNKYKPWQCQYCEKSFATTSDLKQHMSAHGMGKIHKCADCGRQFNNRDSAILHRKQHNNERTHVCAECGKGFFKSSCLTRHLRCHTGEKPFQCEYCQRNFAQVATLKQHKKVCKFSTSEDRDIQQVSATS
eukprot:TRINITY_DN15633_c0_g1_i7.p1 TRINITY_DN15633_c0_g1~~TRINITY_DN15633_c0_g1_i7.p1  ORF type:complete len:704 (-),score=182.46 TRINITY_DN15633_c0_g1_i7:102-2213(-)